MEILVVSESRAANAVFVYFCYKYRKGLEYKIYFILFLLEAV